jgi:hypothetical protein
MPNKYPEKKGCKAPKQAYKVTNWSEYNQALCMRADTQIWLSDDEPQVVATFCLTKIDTALIGTSRGEVAFFKKYDQRTLFRELATATV